MAFCVAVVTISHQRQDGGVCLGVQRRRWSLEALLSVDQYVALVHIELKLCVIEVAYQSNSRVCVVLHDAIGFGLFVKVHPVSCDRTVLGNVPVGGASLGSVRQAWCV